MSIKDSIIPLIGNAADADRQLGGKADSLNRMIAENFPVPRAYCVTVGAYEAFLGESGIDRMIPEDGNLDGHDCEAIRQRIMNTEPPASLTEAVRAVYEDLGKGRVAVRSSALNEDGVENSFAGQYDTFLNIIGDTNVVDAVQRCWGSLWANRAQVYQVMRKEQRGEGDEKTGIAVIIQEMIEADAAGVLFTADPFDGSTDTIVIESCWGVGDGVVSGQVTTDTLRVRNGTFDIAEAIARNKPQMAACLEGGDVRLSGVPAEKVSVLSLSEDKACELARIADRIRQYYNAELDIEWAIKDGTLYILQARPITVTAAREDELLYPDAHETNPMMRDNAIFSRKDTGEIVAGQMSPLGISFCKFYQNYHPRAIAEVGLYDYGVIHRHMGYLNGHVYLNVSYCAHILTQCPPLRDPHEFINRYTTDDMDMSSYQYPYGDPPKGLNFVVSGVYWLYCTLRNAMRSDKMVKQLSDLRENDTRRFHDLDLGTLSLKQLNDELHKTDEKFLSSCAYYMPYFLGSYGLYNELADLCQEWLGDKGDHLENRIKAMANSLRTIEVTLGVQELTRVVDRSEELRKLFLETPISEMETTLRSSAVGARFLDGPFRDFMINFGTRGRTEFDINIARWIDDPGYIYQLVRMYLTNDVPLQERLSETAAKRQEDTERLLGDLPPKVQKKFRKIIKMFGDAAEKREAVRPTFISQTWVYRKLMKEVVRRLDEQGVCNADDFAYMDFNEFRAYMDGRKSAEEAFSPELIEKNRRDYLRWTSLPEPPLSVLGGWVPPKTNPRLLENADGTLTGIPASPGVIVGRARVITDLDRQAEEFKKGEILVTKVTDASWTPLFALSEGVVTDIGSMLAHSSIVSREFGIPAVVNTESATAFIKTGDLLYLDGNSGIVRIEERAEKHPKVSNDDSRVAPIKKAASSA